MEESSELDGLALAGIEPDRLREAISVVGPLLRGQLLSAFGDVLDTAKLAMTDVADALHLPVAVESRSARSKRDRIGTIALANRTILPGRRR